MKLYSTTVICLFIVLCVTGCKRKDVVPDDGMPSASSITYALPDTSVKVAVTLTLESCDPAPAAKPSISITPVAVATEHNRYTLDGEVLKSFFEKRSFNVELYDNGTLKSVSTTSTDATAGIIGGVIKLATMFGAPSGNRTTLGPCNQQTLDNLGLRDTLRSRLKALQQAQQTHSNPHDGGKNIEAIAQEIARLESGPLQVKLSKTIPIRPSDADDKSDSGRIKWTYGEFWKWYDVPRADRKNTAENFALNFCVSELSAGATGCLGGEVSTSSAAPGADDIKVDPGCGSCAKHLVFREPANGAIILSAVRDGDFYSTARTTSDQSGNLSRGGTLSADDVVGKKKIPISQWGTADYVDLNVGFGEDITLSASFDPFGRKQKFGWTSNARGDGIVSGLNTIASEYQTASSARDGEDLAAAKAQIDELETLQKLNKLENCRSILENGGFTCPDQ